MRDPDRSFRICVSARRRLGFLFEDLGSKVVGSFWELLFACGRVGSAIDGADVRSVAATGMWRKPPVRTIVNVVFAIARDQASIWFHVDIHGVVFWPNSVSKRSSDALVCCEY